MLNLINAPTDEEIDEKWLFAAAGAADLILVSGVCGSGHDVVAAALCQVAPLSMHWEPMAKLQGSQHFSTAFSHAFSDLPASARWFFGDLESDNKAKLMALASTVGEGGKAMAYIHASSAIPRLQAIYRNCGKSGVLHKAFSSKQVAVIEVLRPERGGDVFVKCNILRW